MSLKNFKNYLLIGLILTSVIQVGILWDFNFHGLPFNFLKAFKVSSNIVPSNVKKMESELFNPKRIIVSTGAYQSNWVVTKDGDTQEIYKALWNDAEIYIGKLIAGEGIENYSMVDNKWSDIVTSKSISIEFDTPLSQDLVGYFLSSKVKNESGPDFVKLVISPWENESYNVNTIYLLDSNNHVYKYNIALGKNNLRLEDYDSDIEKLNKMQSQQVIRNYMVFSESKLRMPFTIRPDMLVSAYGNKYDKLNQISVSIPDNFHITQDTKLSDIESRFSSIIGSDGDSYDIFTDTNSTVILKNLDNLYRLYSNGILEYKKTGKLVNERGSKVQAYKNAMQFIGKVGLIPSNVQVYLSNVEEGKDSYKFTFNYKVSDIPLYFNVNLNNKSTEKVNNAIVIESNSNSTLSCWWVLRNVDVLKDKKNQYNVNSSDILDTTFTQYTDLKQSKDFSIDDIQIGYLLSDIGTGTRVDPKGIVIAGNKKMYDVKLPVK
jgi:hypothetical protein